MLDVNEPLQEGQSMLAIMDMTGDSRHMWDKTKPGEGSAARAMFDKMKGQGYLAYKAVGDKGDKGEQIHTFDPEAERIIMSPPMAGG